MCPHCGAMQYQPRRSTKKKPSSINGFLLAACVLASLDILGLWMMLMESAQPSLTSGIAENSGVLDAAEALRMVSTYVKPYEPVCLQSMSVMKEEGDLVPDIYWNYDHSVDGSQVSLRLYRDNLLVADNIPLDAECFSDSTAQGGHVHCYELCEVNADGKESYRLMDLVDMPEQHNLFLTASPAEAGIVSGAGMYEYGSVAVIIAEANPGWKFDYWSMGSTMFSEMDSTGVLINSDSRLTAMFSSETSNEDAAASAMPAIQSAEKRRIRNSSAGRRRILTPPPSPAPIFGHGADHPQPLPLYCLPRLLDCLAVIPPPDLLYINVF